MTAADCKCPFVRYLLLQFALTVSVHIEALCHMCPVSDMTYNVFGGMLNLAQSRATCVPLVSETVP